MYDKDYGGHTAGRETQGRSLHHKTAGAQTPDVSN